MFTRAGTIFLRYLMYGTILFAPVPICFGQISPHPEEVIPDELRVSLQQYRDKDDLSGWVYAQIQWVSRAPARRSGLLPLAVKQAWRKPRSMEEMQAWQDLLTNEGYAMLLTGAIVPSTDAYSAAYEWARGHPEIADEGLILENILKPLGNNYTRLGDYEQALIIHRKALTMAVAAKDRREIAGVCSNLANTYSNMGRPEHSLEYCRQGLAEAGAHSALRGLLLSEQADAYMQLQKDDDARTSIIASIAALRQAMANHEDPAAGYWLLTAYQQAGDIYGVHPERSLDFLRQALVLQDKLLHQQGNIRERERAKLFQRLGALFARLHQPAPAKYWMDQCLSVLLPGKPFSVLRASDLYAENTLADLLYARAGLAETAGQTEEAIRLYDLSFATERLRQHELITGTSKERWAAESRVRYETAIGVAWDAWKKVRQNNDLQAMLRFMEVSKAQLLLEEVLQQEELNNSRTGDPIANRIRLLQKAQVYYEKERMQAGRNDSLRAVDASQAGQVAWELAQLRKAGEGRAPRRAATFDPGVEQGVSLDSLRQLLKKGQAIRSYFAGKDALYMIECSPDGIRFADKLTMNGRWQDSIRNFISTWFGQGANAMIDHPALYYRQAYALYRNLFGDHPFDPGIEYILLTDGALSLLPVDALVTQAGFTASPAEWPFVLRQTVISYGWSLQTLIRQHVQTGVDSGLSGFFLSGNQRSSIRLGSVAGEKGNIQQVIKGGYWYVDAQATAERFRNALTSSSVVHVSSHAYAKKDSFDVPFVELYDEPFYLFELQGLSRHPALVVLSACRTGDGRLVTGEGAQSLARAFIAGGTNAVVAGQWNVNDETAAQLMKGFYSNLVAEEDKRGGRINAAEALQKSKLQWLNDPAIPYLHKLPYYWAALSFQGDPEALRNGALLPAAASDHTIWPGWYVLLAVLAILAAIGRRRQRSR
ncbi:MAG: CHAT domain-containing protein [Bacteroidota bacterium]|nr:CHAT domain-containing protein [Bacteroidota bacterium]MDP4253638.1 CHAT domain-containing protein [Bacteroidota bacterium]